MDKRRARKESNMFNAVNKQNPAKRENIEQIITQLTRENNQENCRNQEYLSTLNMTGFNLAVKNGNWMIGLNK